MNNIKNLIKNKEQKCFSFKPDLEFYQTIGINRKRWGQIYRGDIEPTISDAKAIADYFEFELIDLI